MEDVVKDVVRIAVARLIERTLADESIRKIVVKHDKKLHFVPHRYRVLGGLLQSLNIQFGSFIEELLAVAIKQEEPAIRACVKTVITG